MTARKTTPATAEAAAETPAEAKTPRTPRKPTAKTTTARSTTKTATARKTPAKASAAAPAKTPRKPKATDWANLYEHEPTPAETVTPAPTTEPTNVKNPTVRVENGVEMTVTPVRGFARPKRHQLSFRMPTDIPALLTEAQQLLFEQGRGQSRDLIVAEAIRQWVERERAALARAKAKAKEPEAE